MTSQAAEASQSERADAAAAVRRRGREEGQAEPLRAPRLRSAGWWSSEGGRGAGSGMPRRLGPGGWERSPFLLQLLLWLHTRSLAEPAAQGKRGPTSRRLFPLEAEDAPGGRPAFAPSLPGAAPGSPACCFSPFPPGRRGAAKERVGNAEGAGETSASLPLAHQDRLSVPARSRARFLPREPCLGLARVAGCLARSHA